MIVRPYQPMDRETVIRISCDTALLGQPIDSLFTDRRLIGESLVGYYLEFEPELTFVAEENGRVVGYVTGCRETQRYERIFARRILPRLIRRLLFRGHLLRANSWRLLSAIRQSGSHWARLRHHVMATYPAHCHINLATGSRHAGTGSTLLETLLLSLRRQGVPGIHIISATEPGKSFFRKMGFTLLVRYPSAPLPGCPRGEAWVMGKLLVDSSSSSMIR